MEQEEQEQQQQDHFEGVGVSRDGQAVAVAARIVEAGALAEVAEAATVADGLEARDRILEAFRAIPAAAGSAILQDITLSVSGREEQQQSSMEREFEKKEQTNNK